MMLEVAKHTTYRTHGVDVVITRVGNKYQASIDGEVLDTYNTEDQARQMAVAFAKQYSSRK